MAAKAIPIGPTARQVASNVERIRKARGLNQKDLSALMAKVGMPMLATVVSKTERCERRVDVDDLVALATVLGVSTDELLHAPCEAPHTVDCLAVGLVTRLADAVRDVVAPQSGTDVARRTQTARRLMAQLALELDEITDAVTDGHPR